MIRLIYKDEQLWNYRHAIWTISIFLLNSFIFWYFVLLCCFRQLAFTLPIPLSIIILLLSGADRLYCPITTKLITPGFIVDCVVWLLLVLGFYLPWWIGCYLGLAVIIYLYDIVYLKQLLFDMVRRRYWVYKIYIIFKIVYWVVIYGHLIGCIFYTIDIYLIKQEQFGAFALNPQNYYQGTLLAYTPILMFGGFNRYVYAMYYSFSLISTIAFGDIIGLNYMEDAYMMILIILSTIVISLIIEQMYIIFRRRKTRYLQLINKVRFLSQRLKGYHQIPSHFRHEIINYLIDSNWRIMNQYPQELFTATEFKNKIIQQSVITNPQLPSLYANYLLHKLTLTHLPKGILANNNGPQKQLVSYLTTQGQFWVGYSTPDGKPAGGYVVKEKGFNFGIEQTLVGTNNIYPMLSIRTITSGTALTISQQQIKEVLEELSKYEFPCDKPIEHYQIGKDQSMFNKNKYQCSICLTTEHTLINCPKCHYIVQKDSLSSTVNQVNSRGLRYRKALQSKKIKGQHLETIQQVTKKNWKIIELQRLLKILQKMRGTDSIQTKPMEKWYKWPIYGEQLGFNSQIHIHRQYKDDIQQIFLSPKKSSQHNDIIQH